MKKDKAGLEIFKGDYIIYATLLRRSAALKFGFVLEVGKSLKVVSVGNTWEGKDKPIKAGYLQFSERCLVIKSEMIPSKIHYALDKAKAPYVKT